MEKIENEEDELLFEIDDNAWLLSKIWLIMISLALLFGLYLLNDDFQVLLNNTKSIFAICMLIAIVIINLTAIIIFLKNNQNKILFYKNKIIRTKYNRIIYIKDICEIYKFISFIYNDKKQFRYDGINKVIMIFALFSGILMIIAFPKVIIGIIYIYIVFILSQTIYLYIKTKKFTITNKIRTLEILNDKHVINFVLDGLDNNKKINDYFQKYANIDISQVQQNIFMLPKKQK